MFERFKARKAAKAGMKDQKDRIDGIYKLFEEYRSAYAAEWERLEDCERMYRGEHWYGVEAKDNEPQPVTPIIQSTIENVHADLMDNIPEAIIEAEDPDTDTRVALVVDAVIKQNHDAASYAKEYWLLAHDILTGGYMVQEIGYNPVLNNGLGGAFVRRTSARTFMADPLVTELQDSRAVFKFASKPIAWMEQHYPEYKGQFLPDIAAADTPRDGSITRDDTKNVLLIECWQREFDKATSSYKVHMCKVGGHKLLEDSRKTKPEGYFKHGEYPFIVTPLYVREGTCLGLGFVDMFKTSQKYADKLDQIVLKNAVMASKMKMLVTEGSGFDVDDLRDWSKEVHVGQTLNGIQWFPTPPLPAYIIEYIERIRNSIKEESGANEFSRGGTAGGITAASAVAMLQEMSNKRSRTATRQMHEAFKDAIRMEIEVEREFNELPREVTITVDGQKERAAFDSSMLEKTTPKGNTLPIEFSISIKVQKENRWTSQANNEFILSLVQAGQLPMDIALEAMHFDGRDVILSKLQALRQAAPVEAQMPPEQVEAMQAQAAQQDMGAALEQIPQPEAALG
ncbi:MAG TPA: hypothetical protein VN512_13150 [Clostridia bacterium]|nr:hypothetical protein [Clostridia bacterium]